jgi:hypothetical protein
MNLSLKLLIDISQNSQRRIEKVMKQVMMNGYLRIILRTKLEMKYSLKKL